MAERVVDGVFVLAALAAAWSDVRTRRIPNAWTLGLIAFGVAGNFVIGGWMSASESLGLAAAAIAIGSFVYAKQWLAGGDIKLMAGGIAVFGCAGSVDFLILTGLTGGVLSAIVAMRQRRLLGILNQIAWSVAVPGTPLQSSANYGPLPYGVAIAGGAMLVTLARCFTGLRLL